METVYTATTDVGWVFGQEQPGEVNEKIPWQTVLASGHWVLTASNKAKNRGVTNFLFSNQLALASWRDSDVVCCSYGCPDTMTAWKWD